MSSDPEKRQYRASYGLVFVPIALKFSISHRRGDFQFLREPESARKAFGEYWGMPGTEKAQPTR